ncbi:MAG TPA: hypothetical protein VGF45_13975, partial [Polyangia bacterium]
RNSTAPNTTSVAYFEHGDPASPVATVPIPFALGSPYRITTLVQGGRIECVIDAAKISRTGVPSLNGAIRLRVRNLGVSIKNVVAYNVGAP